jgi:hypothetical protein
VLISAALFVTLALLSDALHRRRLSTSKAGP